MIRLCPGCECQPVVPPGCQTLLWRYRSEGPFVFCFETHAFASSFSPPVVLGRMMRLETSKAAKVPLAIVVPTNPLGVVAETFPVWKRAVTMIAAPHKANPVNFCRISDLLGLFAVRRKTLANNPSDPLVRSSSEAQD